MTRTKQLVQNKNVHPRTESFTKKETLVITFSFSMTQCVEYRCSPVLFLITATQLWMAGVLYT